MFTLWLRLTFEFVVTDEVQSFPNAFRPFAELFLPEHIYMAAQLSRWPMLDWTLLVSCRQALSYAELQSVSCNSESPLLLSFTVKGALSSSFVCYIFKGTWETWVKAAIRTPELSADPEHSWCSVTSSFLQLCRFIKLNSSFGVNCKFIFSCNKYYRTALRFPYSI